jgi:AcrR family transcriptional regulator
VAKTAKKLSATQHSALDGMPPRRRAIVSAAFSVLMERGYAGASTLEIATRAKVSKRELYAEFGNKQGILEALIATTAARMQVPLSPPEIGDRHAFSSALIQYGIIALGELTSPPVLAINRLAIAESGRSADLGQILDQSGREPNRKALGDLMRRAQAAGFIGAGDPDRVSGQFFALLFGDLILRLLLGVIPPPTAREIKDRSEAAAVAVLALHPA